MATATIANTPVTGVDKFHSFMGHLNRDSRLEVGYLTFNGGDYVTDGIAWHPDTMAAAHVELIIFENPTGYNFNLDRSTGKLIVYSSATTQFAQSAISFVVRYLAIGKH